MNIIADPAPKVERPRKQPYSFITSEESTAFFTSLADGKYGRNYTDNEDAGLRYHQVPGKAHRVELRIEPDEVASGATVQDLRRMTNEADTDMVFAMLYVMSQIAPPTGTSFPAGMVPYCDIHIESVAEVMNPNYGTLPRTERDALRRKAYQSILFGTRAKVVGSRSVTYTRPVTKETLETRIEAPVFAITSQRRPQQPTLWPDDEIPDVVEITVSRHWLPLLTDPLLAQYLPCGEILGGIPGGKVGGAWARSIGLALADYFRRRPRQVVGSVPEITRREILTRFPPKTGDAIAALTGKNADRGVEYYVEALSLLVEKKFLAPVGEATPGRAGMRFDKNGNPLRGKGWLDRWLDTAVVFAPGEKMVAVVKERADAQPLPPRTLPSIPRRRGRKPN